MTHGSQESQLLYKHPWSRIQSFLQILLLECDFSREEIFCEPSFVFEDKVIFEIHVRLKELLRELSPPVHGIIEFHQIKNNEQHRYAVVSAGGVESFLFARMLKTITDQLRGIELDPTAFNIELIEAAIKVAIKKGGRKNEDFPKPTIIESDGFYCVNFEVKEGVEMNFNGRNVDFILRDICERIPKQLQMKE